VECVEERRDGQTLRGVLAIFAAVLCGRVAQARGGTYEDVGSNKNKAEAGPPVRPAAA
jgi:hypothetical protein